LAKGRETLSGPNTYSGGTTIANGTLTLDVGDNRLLSTGTVVIGSVATTGKLILGGTSVSNQTLTSATTTGLGGSVVGGNAANNSLLTLNIASGSSTYTGTLGGGGANENRLALTKAAAGTLLLTGTNNNYAGLTNVIDSGVLDVGTISSGALSSNSGLLLGSSVSASGNFGILQGNGTFTRSVGGGATPNSTQVASAAGGFAARGGNLTVNFGGAGAQIALNQGGFIFGNNFIFGSSSADSKVILINSINLNSGGIDGTRTFTVRAGIGGAEATSAELRGVVANGPQANGIRKEGDGMLILSAENTYTGPTLINVGTVQIGTGGTTGSINATGAVTIVTNAFLNLNRSNTMTFRNAIGGGGAVRQVGSGTTILTQPNTYGGGTTVAAGSLLANNTTGSATGTEAVGVSGGATLGGTGTISGLTTIAPGGKITGGIDTSSAITGTLSFQNGLSAAGSTWLVDLVQNMNMDSDRIAVTGNLDITGAIFMDRFSGSFVENNAYTIATYTGSLTGTFLGWDDDTERAFADGRYLIKYNDGNAITLRAVPEPASVLFLLLIGLPAYRFYWNRRSVKVLAMER